jgi:hypothetical protein
MKLLRYFVIAAGLALAAGQARAQDPVAGCPSCAAGGGYGAPVGYGHGGHFGGQPPTTLARTLFQGNGQHTPSHTPFRNLANYFQPKQKLPAFQAAPWYNYWPYDAHFLTPAPISGPFYGPPLTGNFPVNPYFPGPAYPVGGYGQGIPGGPPPVVAPPGR